ncbi:hypothetical protein [Moraxella lacunata]|uniref:hypothetical protein n=1 Tax=Moraxella lacunata TaxID=477 RepID=UPI003EE0F5CF
MTCAWGVWRLITPKLWARAVWLMVMWVCRMGCPVYLSFYLSFFFIIIGSVANDEIIKAGVFTHKPKG